MFYICSIPSIIKIGLYYLISCVYYYHILLSYVKRGLSQQSISSLCRRDQAEKAADATAAAWNVWYRVVHLYNCSHIRSYHRHVLSGYVRLLCWDKNHKMWLRLGDQRSVAHSSGRREREGVQLSNASLEILETLDLILLLLAATQSIPLFLCHDADSSSCVGCDYADYSR